MCGLAAIFAHAPAAPPVERQELAQIRGSMALRGPDGFGEWVDSDARIGLAHSRLAIIDLSADAAQPMESADRRTRIVFNGEIYNYRALRAELEQAGTVFRTHSDTEVLLCLYRRYGAAMVSRLRGMFAFAIWDEDKRGLLLARDHFGIKPLYVAESGGTVRAASQVKALLAGGKVDTTPQPAGHAGFFLWGHVPEPFTLYRGIRALPAGSWLWIDEAGNRREGQYFDLAGELAEASAQGADAAAPEALRAALLDSMRHHLEADVPVGVFLSGGLDSTALTGLAVEAGGCSVKTITLGFDEFAGTPQDEVPLAELVAAHYRTDHRTFRVSAEDFAASRADVLAAMDQPSVDGVNTWFVARAARARGLKVALSGLGGDELFAGYNTFADVPRLVRKARPFAGLPWLGRLARRVSAPWIGRVMSPKAAGLLEYGGSFSKAYLLRRGLFMPWELGGILHPDLAQAGWRALSERQEDAYLGAIGPDRLKVTALEITHYMRNQLLRDSDWAGMAHSLEIRVPLVDIGLFRAALPLIVGPNPPSKRAMAGAARPALPDVVMAKPKTGFFVPVANWLGEPDLRGWARRVYADFTNVSR